MDCGCEQDEVQQRERKNQQARQSSHRARARQSRAIQDETPDDGGMPAVEPEVIAVFVEDQELRGDAQRQHPLPFGHDWLGGADDDDYVVMLRRQLCVQPLACFRVGIIGDAVYSTPFAPKMFGQAGIAGYEIGLQVGVLLIKAAEHVLEQQA